MANPHQSKSKEAGSGKDEGKGKAKSSTIPSANWLAQKDKISKPKYDTPRKRRKLNDGGSLRASSATPSDLATLPRSTSGIDKGKWTSRANSTAPSGADKGKWTPKESGIATADGGSGEDVRNGESISALRKMVAGEVEYAEKHKLPGKYLAVDCEMVGVGINGSESSLGRVSMVNFYGYTVLDAFVRQRERVMDYRTQWSGIRPLDMVNAQPFTEIQKQVADLIKDRILVGHAVHNDLKALLLSHPYPLTRDTQHFAGKFELLGKSKRPALRNLVKQELGVAIQEGEHSSVIDARATMAIYRIHRKEWEKAAPRVPPSLHVNADAGAEGESAQKKTKGKKRKHLGVDAEDMGSSDEDEDEVKAEASTSKRAKVFPGGGKKGVSSGLSTVVRGGDKHGKGANLKSQAVAQKNAKTEWWKELPNTGVGGGKKGSMKISLKY
ncbi:ribonuclease H-like domain-containing protein [Cyathus striatus]|nr:ribonuclease H-like domain-containing protein [Cyathus striatus]